jgi:hypothetical protein
MLKGSRAGILKKVQPLSIHGQISWDVFFTDADDEDGPVQMARATGLRCSICSAA